MALILASASPRRKELLRFITEDFSVRVSDVDEHTDPNLTPEEAVVTLAKIKGEAVSENYPDDTIISADTVVVLNDKILGKPHSPEEAFSMLSSLSGNTHTVYTGVYIISENKKIGFYDKTEVTFYTLSGDEINNYIKTGEPFDKAGAYGIQGLGAILIKGISGDYYNVMGLPVAKLARTLKENDLL
ncbi:MAG: septum formation inhibitor Maf [Clostridia bacterium]|nr:septum formation inhibitor Maf [Clostridia bacterium]